MIKTMVVTFDDKDMEPGTLRVSDCHEIVRCKDCAWVSSYKRRNPITGKLSVTVYNCSGHFWEPEGLNEVEPDGFCAWGERKEEC